MNARQPKAPIKNGVRNALETPVNILVFPNAPHMIIPTCEPKSCHWCGELFTPTGRDSQKFCTPGRERKLNAIRKKALVGAVARQLRRMGLTAPDMLLVARKCVDVAYEAVMKAMICLGWKYDVKAEVWIL